MRLCACGLECVSDSVLRRARALPLYVHVAHSVAMCERLEVKHARSCVRLLRPVPITRSACTRRAGANEGRRRQRRTNRPGGIFGATDCRASRKSRQTVTTAAAAERMGEREEHSEALRVRSSSGTRTHTQACTQRIARTHLRIAAGPLELSSAKSGFARESGFFFCRLSPFSPPQVTNAQWPQDHRGPEVYD